MRDLPGLDEVREELSREAKELEGAHEPPLEGFDVGQQPAIEAPGRRRGRKRDLVRRVIRRLGR